MSFFSSKKSTHRYGVVIDIGSGSVLTAIVHSDPAKKVPKIVWSHREHAPLKNIEAVSQSAKAVMTALLNASLVLDSSGKKALTEYKKSAVLTEIQCTISAPWSYTITKTINYDQKKPFTITEDLLEDLKDAVEEKVESDTTENDKLLHLGLQTVVRTTMDVLSNGYRVKNPIGNKAESLTISRASAVTQKYLIDAIDEVQEKLFTNLELHKLSFILALFSISRDILNQTYDMCLVDVTYEATEIGIVRNGVLKYCTHTSFGSFSIAREISKITKVTMTEAFGYLHTEKPYEFMKDLTKTRKADIETVFETYVKLVSDLFHETGDTLAIPKRIALHSDLKSETLFLDLIEKAAKRSIKTSPFITPMSNEIIKIYSDPLSKTKGKKTKTNSVLKDTALLVSAQFFHTQGKQQGFEYL